MFNIPYFALLYYRKENGLQVKKEQTTLSENRSSRCDRRYVRARLAFQEARISVPIELNGRILEVVVRCAND